MTVIVKHNKTNTITDWTQAQLDEQIALGNFPSGTTLANIVLPSDWNNDHTLTGLGTMAEQDATAVAITGGTINNTTIGATTATTGKFTSVTTPSVTATTNDLTLSAISTGAVKFSTPGGLQAQVTDQTSADLVWTMKGGSSSLAARATLGTNSGAPNFYATGNTIIFTTNGANNADALRISHTASAVNYVQVTGGATSNSPVISAQGSDAAVALSITSKGTNAIRFLSNNAANLQFRIVGTNTAVNNLAVTGTIATNAPSLSSEGSDTNISMAFQPKGTGAIDLAAGSSGVNISNGGTVTALTRTSSGGSYTSIPSIAISAPTTAGGVQATANANVFVQAVALVSGGTGYTVGNTLTLVGGTFTAAATLTVSTVSAGVITGVTVASGGTAYTVMPTNPISVTGGTGTDATFNATAWGVAPTFTITNAGSGYVEQPTVTFSGGGGSGAAAYATVGSTPVIRSLGQNLDFYTPNNTSTPSFRVLDNQSAGTGQFISVRSSSTIPLLLSSAALNISSTSTNNVSIFTNANSQEQMRVSHTASAVNYVQVTGSATGGQPTISPQGSDTNIPLQFNTKGNQAFNFYTNGGTQRQFRIVHTSSSVNFGYTAGSATGTAVTFGVDALSSDTNIDLALTPKGTGLVRFGTYVAGALLATGYINIKAADGTTYKVLVST